MGILSYSPPIRVPKNNPIVGSSGIIENILVDSNIVARNQKPIPHIKDDFASNWTIPFFSAICNLLV